MSEYTLIKLLHIGALLFWLGPPFGAWLVLKVVGDENFQPGSTAGKVNRVFFYTIILEHIAFVLLLASGFYLAMHYNWFGSEWLTQKLMIVAAVIIPLEVVDVLLGNWVANRASRKLYAGNPLKSWEAWGLKLYHGWFTRLALVVIPISVLLVMYLAIGKVGF